MPRLRRRKMSKRTVEGLSVEGKDAVFWDRELPGFGVRVYPSGVKAYVVQTRAGGRSRRVTVGRHGRLSTDEARRQAVRIMAGIGAGAGDGIGAGEEPAFLPPGPPRPEAGRSPVTVADLAASYLDDHVALRCKPRTLSLYRAVIHGRLLPELGEVPVAAVGREHAASLHHRLRRTPYAANRAIEVLGGLIGMAEERGLRPAGGNPCRFVVRYKEHRRERFLSDEEFRRLGGVLEEAEDGAVGGVSPAAAAALRLLVLTGCRRSEILSLRWQDVDAQAGELRLPDSKTGARLVPLSPAALNVLSNLPRAPDRPWVIPGRKPGAPLRNLHAPWKIVRARAGLDDVRIHDLRHSFASRALALGESLPMIGKLLGHRRVRTTARYAHLARDAVNASAARVADSIGTDVLAGAFPPDADRPASAAAGRRPPPPTHDAAEGVAA